MIVLTVMVVFSRQNEDENILGPGRNQHFQQNKVLVRHHGLLRSQTPLVALLR